MELLVTVASLLVALYAVIPGERQMELRFRIGMIEWSVLLIGFVLMLHQEYYTFFVVHGWAPDAGKWPRGFTPTSIKPLFVLLLAVFLGVHVRFARLSRCRIGKFAEFCQELNWRESYPELIALLAGYIKEFFLIYHADCRLPAFRQRLASRVVPTFEDTVCTRTSGEAGEARVRCEYARMPRMAFGSTG
jgi:hypothetical protein